MRDRMASVDVPSWGSSERTVTWDFKKPINLFVTPAFAWSLIDAFSAACAAPENVDFRLASVGTPAATSTKDAGSSTPPSVNVVSAAVKSEPDSIAAEISLIALAREILETVDCAVSWTSTIFASAS